ncbi:MAG: MBL fold metallo-hydrolase RNA specificity domain-containing protein, partial [Candidatus Micrarchaeota archaeon]|nr:MBL fold metallo-hydrolase RNA specificity domain-containing protein [Candidatus Micrarchaeota archaeon]
EDVHPSAKAAATELVKAIQKTLDRGGKVLIPTFAIGRGQEMLFLLDGFMRSGLLEKTPVYLDGMVNKVLRIYRHNAPMLKREILMRILTSDEDPFKSIQYRIPKNKDRSDVLAEEKAIILATSGMLNGGPVLNYLRHLGPDEKNTLLFVGFQAQGTRGREILEGAKEIKLDEDMVPLNLQILQNRFSGHSDQPELLQFIRSMHGLKDIFIVHGEKAKSEALAEAAQKIHKNARIHVPALGEQITI